MEILLSEPELAALKWLSRHCKDYGKDFALKAEDMVKENLSINPCYAKVRSYLRWHELIGFTEKIEKDKTYEMLWITPKGENILRHHVVRQGKKK